MESYDILSRASNITVASDSDSDSKPDSHWQKLKAFLPHVRVMVGLSAQLDLTSTLIDSSSYKHCRVSKGMFYNQSYIPPSPTSPTSPVSVFPQAMEPH